MNVQATANLVQGQGRIDFHTKLGFCGKNLKVDKPGVADVDFGEMNLFKL